MSKDEKTQGEYKKLTLAELDQLFDWAWNVGPRSLVGTERLDQVLEIVCEVKELRINHEALVDKLRSFLPPEVGENWWCPTCKDAISPHQVSVTEHCEICGTYLSDCQPESEQIKETQQLLTQIETNTNKQKDMNDEKRD